MRISMLFAVAALAVPALSLAQVGPNPAVSGGSLDPTMGASRDSMTAPEDVRVGTPPAGNIIDRSTGVAGVTTGDGPTAKTATDGAATTATETKAETKPMRHKRR